MGTEKRARQKANRQERVRAALEAQKKAQKKRQIIRIAGIVGAALAFFLLYWLFTRGGDEVETVASTTSSPGGATSTSAAAAASTPPITAPPPGEKISGDTPCPKADGSEKRTTTFAKAPPMCIDATKVYSAKVTTSIGEMTFTLDAKAAPKTVNNFVVLSRYHYYDGVPFHRIVPDFVAQVGDANPTVPDQLGGGGPGYSFADELPASVDAYTPGALAMANSGPATNGSQFFIWYGPTKLPTPAYSLFGKVTGGFDTVGKELLAAGTASQKPSKVITIDKIEIKES